MSCNQQNNSLNIDVNITNLVLTPSTCTFLVSKIIKNLIYGKSQIPYPYEWLKTIVNKKRAKVESDSEVLNHQAERHFRVVSTAYDTTEAIISQIKNMFKSGCCIEEILLLLGGSELTPKEVYRIRIPELAFGHIESNHITMTNKFSHTVLRKIFLSPEWMSAIDHNLPLTNMFIFVKTNGRLNSEDFFIPNSSFYLPKRALITNINLIYKEDPLLNCCSNLEVFQDRRHKEESAIDKKVQSNLDKKYVCEKDNSYDENLESEWLQANIVFKGFKESFVNKEPLSQLW